MKTIAELSGHEKMTGKMRHVARRTLFIIFLFLLIFPSTLSAATMTDYCMNPPFIVGGVLPNLLMMFDNSSSMFDLNYADKGGATRPSYYCYDQTYRTNQCSANAARKCTKSSECATGQTCLNLYSGIFEVNKYYEYNSTNGNFEEIAAFPPALCATFTVADTVCTGIDKATNPWTVTFAAKGNYLNWLTASKFDIQKTILTGGKYLDMICASFPTTACTTAADCPSGGCVDVLNFLQSETRGCVGQLFVKEPNTVDFQEYTPVKDANDIVINNPNTGLGVTFGVKGPAHPYNESAPSPGGQTYIDIFEGNYDAGLCQKAVEYIVTEEGKQATTDAIAKCLEYTKGGRCFNDPAISCTKDADCLTDAGTCDIKNDGLCNVVDNGDCSANADGVCAANNGTCTGAAACVGGSKAGTACTLGDNTPCKGQGVCMATCIGGGKAGAQCLVAGDCAYKSCTNAGSKFGTICTAATDCNTKTCKNAGIKLGNACVNSHPDCDTSACTAGKIGPPPSSCAADADCNTSSCTAGKVGSSCAANADCDFVRAPCVGDPNTQVKSTFAQNMHACYQYNVKDQDFGQSDLNTISGNNGCNVIYRDYKICNGGARDGLSCTVPADCTGGGTCVNGPSAIRPGSVVLACGEEYAGYCASTIDNWQNTIWNARGLTVATDCSYVLGALTDAECCVIKQYEKFCGAMDIPPVVDPTDDPSTTSNYSNTPAILSGTGVQGQLGSPIKTMTVQLRKDTAPTSLLQEYSKKIRFGEMIFNDYGTATECGKKVCSLTLTNPCSSDADCTGGAGRCIDPVPCPKKCSVTTRLSCTIAADCPGGESCIAVSVGVDMDDRDGSKIKHYIGADGYCSATTSTSCLKDSACPGTETCISVGNHNYGLIKEVDRIKAATWTPFTEAFYNSIGYYARFNDPLYAASPPMSRTDLRLNPLDFDDNKNPSQYECQKNNVLLITDGASTADIESKTVTLAQKYVSPVDRTPAGQTGICGKYSGSMNLDDVTWVAKHRNIKTFSPTSTDPKPLIALKNSEMIDTYVVFTGADNGLTGECNSLTMMNQTAANGGTTEAKMAEDPEKLYNALKESFQTIAAGAASGTAASVLASGEGSGANLIQALFYTVRDTFGATTIDPGIKWTGTLKNLWYYIDPFLGNSSIREDRDPKDYDLNISSDKIVNFRFTGDKTVVDLYADANGDGAKDNPAAPSPKDVPFEDVSSLWEAGSLLWTRAASDRKIYTFDGTTFQVFPSSIGSGSPFITLLQAAGEDEATAIARYVRGEDLKVCSTDKKICASAADCAGVQTCDAYRNRTVNSKVWKLGDIINSTPRLASLVPQNLYHKSYLDTTYKKFVESDDYGRRGMVFAGANDGMLHAFYLGQLELFQEKYKKAALSDPYDPATKSTLGKESWAYIPKGALPYLKYMADKDYCHIYNVDATPFIFDVSINPIVGCATDYWDCPKQTKCGANAECTDASNSIDMNNTSWRTILISSMRLGGACTNACTKDVNGDSIIDKNDCVQTPVADQGYSSYFALDITDTLANPDDPTGHPPVLLWEFSNANIPAELATGGLGFATTGPALLRVAPKTGDTNKTSGGLCVLNTPDGIIDGCDNPDNSKNGRFFVVIGSGPTGPIDTQQFRSYSDQPLKIFVLDLKTGSLLKTFKEADLGIKNGFSGSMINSMIDFDQNNPLSVGFYQDDAVYVGYTKAEDDPLKTTTKWNRGGLLRIFTKQELHPENDKWAVSKVMDDVVGDTAYTNIMGPVTAAVSKLQNYTKKTFRLFFGSGRYSYKISQDIDDDEPKDFAGNVIQRRLFGVVEPCFDTLTGTIDFSCTSSVLFSSIDKAATGAGSSDAEGWYRNLDACTEGDSKTTVPCYTVDGFGNTVPNPAAKYKAERMVTDIAATPMGAVFFTTTKPSADICAFGGGTHLWATQYDTGGRVKKGVLRGKAIVQVSTGEIKEVDLKTAFTEEDGVKSEIIPGVTAGPPPGLTVPAQPINKIIHIRER